MREFLIIAEIIALLALNGCAGYDTTVSLRAGDGKRYVETSYAIRARELPRGYAK